MMPGQPVFSSGAGLARLIYRSRSTLGLTARDLPDMLRSLVERARINNGANNLNGILLFDGGNFLQILEGPLTFVERTYEKIACDQRHTDIEVIDLSPIENRRYAKWLLSMVDASNNRFPALTPFMRRGVEAREDDIVRVLADIVIEEPVLGEKRKDLPF